MTTGLPASVPTGTITFLFTDIEGSTRRWEAHREAMKAAVSRHDALMRTAFERHNGYVFKTVGDAFCCAFSSEIDALRGAVAAQLTLAGEDFSEVEGLRVRMGLHTGRAQERDGDYFGPAVNRVARLMSIGHGGQVLLSAATYELVQHDAPEGTTLTDLGMHQLKDLALPERVWQADAAGMQREFPRLRSVDMFPNNLPGQVTSFHGREAELEDVKRLLEAHRLLTLLGAGGVGKTRLAVHVGADLLDHFPDGVWTADLAPITDPSSVTSVVALALGVDQGQGRLSDDTIARWLARKRLLLILDNCEHLLEAVASLADVIHRACPEVRVLATSRQSLGVSGEQVLRLASLAVPASTAASDPATAMGFGAVALFVDRASLASTSFRLDEHNAPIVADICRRLDGIPLAIELAAARAKTLSISTLALRLNERFKILTGGSRTALPRQKTLAATIDWSYELLTPQERVMFNRVGIFAGSFTFDAAARVYALNDSEVADALDLICSLADKSLVIVNTGEDLERYHLLESTRQYAMEKLLASGEGLELARCYAEYYVGVAKEADQNKAMRLSAWLAIVEQELENFRAVLEWALGNRQDAALGGSLAAALQMFWWHGGVEAEGQRWIRLALDQIDKNAHPDIAERLTQALAMLTSRMLYS